MRNASYPVFRKAGGLRPPWSDLVLLGTCNRVEVYAVTRAPGRAAELVRTTLGVSEDGPILYVLEDRDAAAHLIRVASGLDSLAEGEEQVTAQVRNAALRRSPRASPRSPLAEAFVHAARIAAQVRRIAGVTSADASASHAAIRFLEAVLPVEDRIVALIGTGKMARIAAKRLGPRTELRILNRSLARARELAESLGGEAVPLADLPKVLERADVVLAATSVRRRLITARTLQAAIRGRGGRPIWLIDLGFPRNVDPECRRLAGVHVVDLDGLAPWGQRPPSPNALARVEHRIARESERIMASLRPAASADVAVLRKTAEALRRHEVEVALAHLPDLSDDDRAIVDKLATRLVNRFLHGPTEHLRSLPEGTRTEVVRQIVSGLQRGGG
jgi:glutamyl-tRNA reductase